MMNTDTINQLNGAGILLRFVTPLLVGILLAMLNYDITARKMSQEQMNVELQGIHAALDNHVEHIQSDISTIKERLSRIESRNEVMNGVHRL